MHDLIPQSSSVMLSSDNSENALAAIRKIIVIGCPGSGKSSFARRLRDLSGLPLYYLDMLFHRPDRTTVGREEFDRALLQILARDRWIIDGNYQRTLPLRFEAAERIFFFDLPLEDCLNGAARRVGTKREDMPWIEEVFDEDFRQYILDFPRDQLPQIRALIEKYRQSREIVTFRSHGEAEAYLNTIPCASDLLIKHDERNETHET